MNTTDKGAPAYPEVFVIGFSHSGSTLLGRMLDMHSRILCVGELMRIREAMEKGFPCSCGQKIPECEFWTRYLPLIEKANNFQYKRFTPEFYKTLRRASGSEVLVDLSKNKVLRAMNGILSAQSWKSNHAGYIMLLRDPRGVGASMLRTNDKGLDRFLSRYEKWMKRFQKFVKKKNDRVLVVRYEDLCITPEREMKRVCGFMGVSFESGMLRPADQTHHFIHSSTSGFMKNTNDLKVDERWRRELQAEDTARIQDVSGKIDILHNAYPPDQNHADENPVLP